MLVPLWELRNSSGRSQHLIGARSLGINALMKARNFILLVSPVPQSSTAQCQERTPQPAIYPTGKVRVKCVFNFPNLLGCCTGGPLLSCPTQHTKGSARMNTLGTARSREKGKGLSATSTRISATNPTN